MWRLTGWPFDVIRRQSPRDLQLLTEATGTIDWHPPTVDDIRLD